MYWAAVGGAVSSPSQDTYLTDFRGTAQVGPCRKGAFTKVEMRR